MSLYRNSSTQTGPHNGAQSPRATSRSRRPSTQSQTAIYIPFRYTLKVLDTASLKTNLGLRFSFTARASDAGYYEAIIRVADCFGAFGVDAQDMLNHAEGFDKTSNSAKTVTCVLVTVPNASSTAIEPMHLEKTANKVHLLIEYSSEKDWKYSFGDDSMLYAYTHIPRYTNFSTQSHFTPNRSRDASTQIPTQTRLAACIPIYFKLAVVDNKSAAYGSVPFSFTAQASHADFVKAIGKVADCFRPLGVDTQDMLNYVKGVDKRLDTFELKLALLQLSTGTSTGVKPNVDAIAYTSELVPSAAETSKSKPATTSDKKSSSSNGKAKALGEEVEAENEDSDDDGSSSDASSSSSSSFLTTSEEDEVAPTARQQGRQQQQQHDSAMAGSPYGGFNGTMADSGAVEAQQANKRPEMTRPPTPPYIQFGADADAVHNVRAFGKPILWGLLPSDNPSTKDISTSTSEQTEDRTAAMIKEEQAAAESRYTRFREDYVSKMITRFGGSLDAIRQKEADTMTESRLQVLIASIAGGADNFTSKDGKGIWKTSEEQTTGERELTLEALDALVLTYGEAATGGARRQVP